MMEDNLFDDPNSDEYSNRLYSKEDSLDLTSVLRKLDWKQNRYDLHSPDFWNDPSLFHI